MEDTDENAITGSIRPGSTQQTTMSLNQMMKNKKKSGFNAALGDSNDTSRMRLLYGGRKAREYGLNNNSILYGDATLGNIDIGNNYFDENYLFEILY